MRTACHHWDSLFPLEFAQNSPVLKFSILEVGGWVHCSTFFFNIHWYNLVNLSFILSITESFNCRSSPIQLTLFLQNEELIVLAFTGAWSTVRVLWFLALPVQYRSQLIILLICSASVSCWFIIIQVTLCTMHKYKYIKNQYLNLFSL